ncbi:MAG: hypothetical protein HC926_04240 [Synechococcaceae cyanobacterium SM2_3_60]|nr:hypothetical protein [Synechococcaceae cyanobacterium SM2_3_60]
MGQLFNQSIWWDFIRGNRGQNLRLLPIATPNRPELAAVFEVRGQSSVEPVVRILAFEHVDTFQFNLLQTAQPIPGRIIDVQLRQDLTDREAPTLVLLTERGGVALLRSLVVLEYERGALTPLLSVSDLNAATVRLQPGSILVTTEDTPGSSRSALYQWQGQGFQRLEL